MVYTAPRDQLRAWTYAAELGFLEKLGTFSIAWQGKPSRAALLRGYIVGLGKRDRGFTHDETVSLRRIAQNLLNDSK